MKQNVKYFYLGAGHGLNDCIAGFIIGSLFYQEYSPLQAGIYSLLYNLLAFGGQILYANYAENSGNPPSRQLGIAFLLLSFSLPLLFVSAELAILFSGVASAIIHVTGGKEALRPDGKSFSIGIFAAPGIIGLILGGFLASQKTNFFLAGSCLAISAAFVSFFLYKPIIKSEETGNADKEIEMHDLAMFILLTAISLRSFIWDILQLMKQGNFESLFILGIAAMCGKIAGGFLADKFGLQNYTTVVLVLSIPFLTVFRKNIYLLSIGAFLLQSTIPSTTALMVSQMKKKPALAIALSFGISVLLAIILFYTPLVKFFQNNYFSFAALILTVCLMLYYRKTVITREIQV